MLNFRLAPRLKCFSRPKGSFIQKMVLVSTVVTIRPISVAKPPHYVGEIRWTESLVLWSVRTSPLFLHILHMHIFCMIGWKHVGEMRWTESLVLWSIRTAPFLHILHITHAHILNDWLETCT